MQFLGVVTPDGLLSCFQGPYEGSRGDWAMWKEGMQDVVVENAYDEEGDRVYLYGDAAFYLEDGVIGAYRRRRGIPLSEEESVFNAYMAKQRMAVEWGFGKITQYFQFCNLKVNLKYGLSPIAPYYFSSALLANCHTCYNGSKTSLSFECAPPNIREYFQFVTTAMEEEEINVYLAEFTDGPEEQPE
jgi:hypothetical protein